MTFLYASAIAVSAGVTAPLPPLAVESSSASSIDPICSSSRAFCFFFLFAS